MDSWAIAVWWKIECFSVCTHTVKCWTKFSPQRMLATKTIWITKFICLSLAWAGGCTNTFTLSTYDIIFKMMHLIEFSQKVRLVHVCRNKAFLRLVKLAYVFKTFPLDCIVAFNSYKDRQWSRWWFGFVHLGACAFFFFLPLRCVLPMVKTTATTYL